MKGYVAAKFEEKAWVREVQAKLRAAGHDITHDWTQEDDSHLCGGAPDALFNYRASCARADVRGVLAAEFLILKPHDRGKGLYVELGVALAKREFTNIYKVPNTFRILIVGDPKDDSCVFTKLPGCRWYADADSAVASLNA